jgi:hypothetical protein
LIAAVISEAEAEAEVYDFKKTGRGFTVAASAWNDRMSLDTEDDFSWSGTEILIERLHLKMAGSSHFKAPDQKFLKTQSLKAINLEIETVSVGETVKKFSRLRTFYGSVIVPLPIQ